MDHTHTKGQDKIKLNQTKTNKQTNKKKPTQTTNQTKSKQKKN